MDVPPADTIRMTRITMAGPRIAETTAPAETIEMEGESSQQHQQYDQCR
jgi:hypothetical protein